MRSNNRTGICRGRTGGMIRTEQNRRCDGVKIARRMFPSEGHPASDSLRVRRCADQNVSRRPSRNETLNGDSVRAVQEFVEVR